jgi:hypothetical protein
MFTVSHRALSLRASLLENHVHASDISVTGVNVIPHQSSRPIQIYRIVSRDNHHYVDLAARPTHDPIRSRTTRGIPERLVSELIHLLPDKLLQTTVRERDIHPGRLDRALETPPTLSQFEQAIEVPHLPRRRNIWINPPNPPLSRIGIIKPQKQQPNMILIETRNHISLNLTPRQHRITHLGRPLNRYDRPLPLVSSRLLF